MVASSKATSVHLALAYCGTIEVTAVGKLVENTSRTYQVVKALASLAGHPYYFPKMRVLRSMKVM